MSFLTDNKYSLKQVEVFDNFYHGLWDIEDIVRPTGRTWQKKGIDAMLLLRSGKTIKIDEKSRRLNYADILLEEIANTNKDTVGWAFDESKESDYIAYKLPPKKIYLLPADLLRRTCHKFRDTWADPENELAQYPMDAPNRTYTTRNFAVDVDYLFKCMVECCKFLPNNSN